MRGRRRSGGSLGMGCSGMVWDAPVWFGMFWDPLGCPGMLRDGLGHVGML